MSTAIVFASKHGTTRKVATMIQDKLGASDTVLFDLKEDTNPDISAFNMIVVGGSIHASMIQKQVTNFLENNKELILTKVLGLFICCMYEDIAKKEYNEVFPNIFRQHAIAHGQLGGEFKFEKMNFFERIIVRKIAKTNESISRIEQQAINVFVNDLITLR